jgi:iron complex transport system substrate-binding protein
MRTPQRHPRPAAIAVVITAITTALAAAALAGCSTAGSSSTSAPPTTNTTNTTNTTTPSTPTAPPTSTAALFPVKVTASNGRVTIKAKPMRIVSLDPTSTEDLYAVGAGPQVVAVDQDSNYPAGIPKTSLSGLTPNIEAIAKFNPSLVVSSQNSGGLVSAMTKLGVPVLIEPAAATLDGAYQQIVQIGVATGHTAQAVTVTGGMKQQIAAAVSKAGTAHKGMTYYWELSSNPFYSVTSSTFIGQIVGLFGLKNIADAAAKPSDAGYPQLSQEYIVAARPQLIFLADNQAADGAQSPAVVARRPGWSAIPAVKDHEIIGLNDDVASRWGPRLPLLVAEIAQAIEQA